MRKWYDIRAESGEKAATIFIYEEIGKTWRPDDQTVDASTFVSELNALDVETIDLHINSPGGQVFEGNTIYNALKAHKAKVHVKIDGMAASIASVIAMSGDTIEMPENAMMMIHDPSGGVWGTAEDMLKMATALEKIKIGLVATYDRRAKEVDAAKIEQMMADETWMTAEEAVGYGFADTITERVEIRACADRSVFDRFKKVPDRFVNAGTGVFEDKTKNKGAGKMEITLELLASDAPELLAQIQADARNEGAAAELARIRSVQDQLVPGHEKIIDAMMWDGKTTGEMAAVQVIQAEKRLREDTLKDLDGDAPDPVPPSTPPEDKVPVTDPDAPADERAKAQWDAEAKTRGEFDGDFDAFLSWFKAVENGQVKVLKRG